MKQFYETYCTADEKLSAVLRQISWTNNITIMSRAKTEEERSFYIMLCKDEKYRLHLPDKALLQQKLRDIYDSEEEK